MVPEITDTELMGQKLAKKCNILISHDFHIKIHPNLH